MYYLHSSFPGVTIIFSTKCQDWEYPRHKLIYLRELGEGQFGKVLLMRAQVIGPCNCNSEYYS